MGFNFKQKASKPVRGGSGHMVGKQHTGTQTPGQTATKPTSNSKFAEGGKTKMFGKQTARPAHAC